MVTLLAGTYDYVALQFYTSAAALVVQIPLWLVLLTFGQFNVNTPNTPMLWGWYWINGVSYHLQVLHFVDEHPYLFADLL